MVDEQRLYGLPADVYSFAIILWEMTMRRQPWGEVRSNFQVSDMVQEGHRPEVPDSANHCLVPLMQRCWAATPADRPMFDEVLTCLMVLKQTGPVMPMSLSKRKWILESAEDECKT